MLPKLLRDPVYKAAMQRSHTVIESACLKSRIRKENLSVFAADIGRCVQEIVRSDSPVHQCRQHLADAVILMSKYQVLLLDPDIEDSTGLLGTQGITGELKPHLAEIVQRDDELREIFHAYEHAPSFDEILGMVELLYLRGYWMAETMDACRISLNDYNPVAAKDWYWPFIHAMSVAEEDSCRKRIGLKPAINGDMGLTPLLYSSFLNSVLGEARYPDLEWREAFAEGIANGDLQPPDKPSQK